MYIKLRKGIERELMVRCIEKTGSERNLSRILNVPKSSIYYYKRELRNLPEDIFNRMMKLLNRKSYFMANIIERLDDNWGRKKGGRNLIELRIRSGEFDKMIKNLKLITSKRWKKWHARMRRENPDLYYRTLYDKFKKIAYYKFTTLRGERVRNILEKNVADFLHKNKINYEYEPYLKIDNSVFFPDFKIGKVLIECTFWRGYENSSKLKRKIGFYKKENYRIFVIIPENLHKYYKGIKEYVVSDVSELPL